MSLSTLLLSCCCCSHRVSQWVKHAAAHTASPPLPGQHHQPSAPRHGRSTAPDDEDLEPQQQQQQASFAAADWPASAVSSASGEERTSCAGQGLRGTVDAGMLGILPEGADAEEDLAVDAR
jgi:hypothetical protein